MHNKSEEYKEYKEYKEYNIEIMIKFLSFFKSQHPTKNSLKTLAQPNDQKLKADTQYLEHVFPFF